MMPPKESLRSQFLVHCFFYIIITNDPIDSTVLDGNYITLHADDMFNIVQSDQRKLFVTC